MVPVYFTHESFDSISNDRFAQPFWNNKADFSLIGFNKKAFDRFSFPSISIFKNKLKIQRFFQDLFFGKPEIVINGHGLNSVIIKWNLGFNIYQHYSG